MGILIVIVAPIDPFKGIPIDPQTLMSETQIRRSWLSQHQGSSPTIRAVSLCERRRVSDGITGRVAGPLHGIFLNRSLYTLYQKGDPKP